MSKKEESLRSILGSQIDNVSVVAQAVWKALQNAGSPQERTELLALALVERDSVAKVPKKLPNKGIPIDERDQLAKTHDAMIRGHLKLAFFKSRTANEFAAEILRLVDFFETENEQTYTLANALSSPFVPYRELPGTPVHMSGAELHHKLASDRGKVDLIEYIINLPFDEYTECASMLLQVIDDTEDRDLRVALLAAAWRGHEQTIIERAMKK